MICDSDRGGAKNLKMLRTSCMEARQCKMWQFRYSFTYYGPHVSFILGRGKTSLAEHVTFTSRPLGARVCSNRIDDAGAEKREHFKNFFGRLFPAVTCRSEATTALDYRAGQKSGPSVA